MKSLHMTILATFLAAVAPRPAASSPVLEIGTLGGVNAANLSGDTGFDATVPGIGTVSSDLTGTNVGGIGGVFFMVNFTDKVGTRLEVFGDMTGGQGGVFVSVLGIDVTGDMSLNLNYVEVPLLFVASWPTSETFTLRGVIGPEFDFLASANLGMTVSSFGQSADAPDIDVGALFSNYDIGGVIGVEGAFTLGTVNILLDARFKKGFSNVLDDPTGLLELKRNTWSFMAGISFPIRSGAASI